MAKKDLDPTTEFQRWCDIIAQTPSGYKRSLKKDDMHVIGDLFALRFGDDNQVELYSEDDGNYFLKASFHHSWLRDLSSVATDGMQFLLSCT